MKNPQQDLHEIKSMMERSTRFLSLSGLSGIMAGIYALAGMALIYYWAEGFTLDNKVFNEAIANRTGNIIWTGITVLFLSVLTAYILSKKKSNRTTSQLWTPAGNRFLNALFLPVILGALFCFALIHLSYFELISSTTLIFYGLGLIHASQHTLSDIKYLGYGQAILGVLAGFFPEFGLVFWAMGFGLLHIFYGSVMYFKYDR